MTGFSQDVAFAIARIRTEFIDDIGNKKSGTGTGFWVEVTPGRNVFVTNKHNVDPVLFVRNIHDRFFTDNCQLIEVSIELRHFPSNDQGKHFSSDTQFFAVNSFESCLQCHQTADCAILLAPTFKDLAADYEPCSIVKKEQHLAEKSWLETKMMMMDMASFIGFPGKGGRAWWDTEWNLPIGRFATIASRSDIPFTNQQIKTANVTLVSGLSFSGSSGSPVILHEKGIQVNVAHFSGGNYTPPMIVGIMSGHVNEKDPDLPELLQHTGLSYFTRSDSILELL
jgi:hypothetical protein